MKHANCEYVSPRQFKLERDELKGIEYLEHQLFYIKKNNQNLLFLSTSNHHVKVQREKLTQLWLKDEKKAISLIKIMVIGH